MSKETQQFSSTTNDLSKDSRIFGVSVRAHLAIMLIGTVCVSHVFDCVIAYLNKTQIVIGEPLYSLVVAALGFYFGQKTTK